MTEADKQILHKKLVKLLLPEAVDEAMNILIHCDEKWLKSFHEEYNKKSGNTACCAIDLAKDYLVREGKMIQNDNDHFGGILSDED